MTKPTRALTIAILVLYVPLPGPCSVSLFGSGLLHTTEGLGDAWSDVRSGYSEFGFFGAWFELGALWKAVQILLSFVATWLVFSGLLFTASCALVPPVPGHDSDGPSLELLLGLAGASGGLIGLAMLAHFNRLPGPLSDGFRGGAFSDISICSISLALHWLAFSRLGRQLDRRFEEAHRASAE